MPMEAMIGRMPICTVIVVVSATSLYIERKRLFTIADGAALDGAESFSLEDVHRTDAGLRPTLLDRDVRDAVEKYLRDNPRDEFTELRIDQAGTSDGRSSTVELSAYWSPRDISIACNSGPTASTQRPA